MINFKMKYLLLLTVIVSPIVDAGIYAGLATSLIKVRSETGSTSPVTVDVNLGYAYDAHNIELIVRSGVSDDNLNQLVTDIPISSSLLYRFTVNPRDSFKINLILGYSQTEIESSYVDVPTFSETFSGVSWGVGVEESLDSLPQLAIKADFIQLYRGDQLEINSFNVGVRYDF